MSKNKLSASEKSKNAIKSTGKFAIVEGYKIARTNLMYSLAAKEINAVAFTSWSLGEGKSTAAANMAISLSKLGKRVILVDCDLRRPNINNLLKINNERGLSEVLGRFATVDEVIHRNVLPNLDVIPSGAIPPNPSELLGSPQIKNIMERFTAEYDYVIIDTPPIGIVTDAIMLKEYIAGYIAVIRERSTTHGDVENLLQNIRMANSNVMGFLKVGCKTVDNKYGKKTAGYYVK